MSSTARGQWSGAIQPEKYGHWHIMQKLLCNSGDEPKGASCIVVFLKDKHIIFALSPGPYADFQKGGGAQRWCICSTVGNWVHIVSLEQFLAQWCRKRVGVKN